jgi:phage tail sheath gpL-like
VSGAFGDLTTYGAARNSPHLTVLGVRGSPTPPWEWAATLAAVAVPALAIDPARPVQTLQLPGVTAPTIAQRWTWTERDQLLRVGIATWRANDAAQCFIERAITTYTTAPGGAADVSYLDVETLKTLAYLRYDLRQLISLRFPRHKLADDGTAFARGQAVVTPGTLRAEIIARFKQWEAAGLVEGVDQFKADLIVVRNSSDPNRVDALLPPDLVNQFRALAAQIEFLL